MAFEPSGGNLVARKIGVVSPELPNNALLSTHIAPHSLIFWFAEVEALFAYLFHDHLDEALIDEKLMRDPRLGLGKYQRLMAQMHPNLIMSSKKILRQAGLTQPKVPVTYFPVLENLFKNGELQSLFQPIVMPIEAQTKIIGFECLSRIRFDNKIFTPEFLFNYAQEKLLLTNYDKICLMQALSLAPRGRDIMIFVNVRPQTLISPNFLPWFKDLLKKNILGPHQIIMEITEQHCIISEPDMAKQCRELKDLGVRMAVDDFGSGISNLSMIEIMKPDFVKISGRFIKSSPLDPIKQKIIKNILALAGDFKISAIVESVETHEEWQLATSFGAKLAQGFLFFRPMPSSELSVLLS